MQINWESFSVYNQDAQGIRYKFENMCRQLFALENLSANKQFRYLHADPNNHGLETEPIYDEVNDQWIGFQAKFFDNRVGYEQIKHSALKTVEYYIGKVDLVFLFCNKPLTMVSLTETLSILQSAGIELQLITDTAILDLVRKYPHIGLYYFGNHTISPEWFNTHTSRMFEVLGERYNRDFNVETEYLDELSLFVHDQRAADYLNAKKSGLLKKIGELYWRHEKYRSYFRIMEESLISLPNVRTESLYHSTTWKDTVLTAVQPFIDEFEEELDKLKINQKDKYQLYCDSEKTKEDQDAAFSAYKDICRMIDEIQIMIGLLDTIEISDEEKKLLSSNVLTLYGRAGTGKSQLLAAKTQSLLNENRSVLLLVAGIYYTNDPIQEQIMKNLGLDYSFEELIDILETIGEKENKIVPIFIDAINETWHNRLWGTGLPVIIDKIKQSPMLRLVISYRPEYEKLVIPKSIREGELKTARIIHRGFENNSIYAAKEFLNHHNIPFTPLEYFGYEIENPLFLTLYCKTYDGQEVSLPELYERLLEYANKNIYRANTADLRSKGYTEEYNLLDPLIINLAEYFISNERRHISKKDLNKLDFWNEYGLTAPPFVELLVKENLLHTTISDGKEIFYFAYDQMNDYYCAKAILEMHSNKEELKKYLSDKVLEIRDGEVKHYDNIDLFVNACALYAEKYGEECIDIINDLEDSYDKHQLISRYIASFQWRKARFIPVDSYVDLIHKYRCTREDVWQMLIGNSVKVTHPMNADYLHEFLSGYPLNKRDYNWTCYINGLTGNDSDRIIQLIQMYEHGEKFEKVNEKQIELLLTLFSWILTSSNRWLRDHTSKAMIEILKEHFNLCQPLLMKFNDVNDPYVIQRLYGIVFGACCKRSSAENLQPLAEYVYCTIFDQEKVYPDILLRDYARLIIEKFLIEEPDYSGLINREKIVPPYNSDPIPEIEDQQYLAKDYSGATYWLISSMRFEGMGMYGDFGRYVFQSALRNFDVDDKKMFNYAMHYIFNELGFNEEYFEEHDRHCGGYDRHRTAKTERIGKKYQWITMYNMLARISDNCKMIDCGNYLEKTYVPFEGAWEPYVRDFDPTLNQHFMVCDDTPIFKVLNAHIDDEKKENRAADISTSELQTNWLEKQGNFLNQLKDTLILNDDDGQQWVSLTKYCGTKDKDLITEKLQEWSWLYAYFVSKEQAEELTKCSEKGLSVISSEISSHHDAYTIYNREYPWSPSCRIFKECAWVDAYIKTGEYETVTETRQIPDFSKIDAIIRQYSGNDDGLEDEYDDFEAPGILMKEMSRHREIKKVIGKIMHATTDLIWEEQYDASKEETISQSMPCAELIEVMDLRQLTADGFFYDPDGKLAAFDVDLTQKVNTVVVRKDILDLFLERTGYMLVWLVDAEKEIHKDNRPIESWSEWEAVFVYVGCSISGEIRRLHKTV